MECDPERSIVFVQSHVTAHSELMWLLNTITYMGELRRMTQFKDKTAGAEGESIAVGLFDYPVLMAADILLYQANAVPVGEDQKQHVELTRDVAERFNNAFGKTFVVPEPIIREGGARVMSLDDPAKKMSKSAGSENSYVAVMDAPDAIRRKIRRAVTDSGAEVKGGPDKPALTNLLDIYAALSGESVAVIEARYEGRGYADFKTDLAEIVVEALSPIQARIRQLRGGQELHALFEVHQDRRQRAEGIAGRTLAKARERIGLVPRPSGPRGRGRSSHDAMPGKLASAAVARRHDDLDRNDEVPHRRHDRRGVPLTFWRGKGRIVASDDTSLSLLVRGVRTDLTWDRLAVTWDRLLSNHTLTVDELGGEADGVGISQHLRLHAGRWAVRARRRWHAHAG